MMAIDVNQSILEILSKKPATGMFTKIVELGNNEKVTYRFSWVVGMHLNHVSRMYKDHFGSALPDWVNLQHPRHMVKLCQLALDTSSPLPNHFNKDY